VVIFATAVSGFLHQIGLPSQISFTIVSLAVSSFVLTTLDTVARLGRLSFQELFSSSKILASKPMASVFTLLPAYLLAVTGYQNIWTLFGAANQLLAALTLIACILFFRKTKRRSFMLYIPTFIMLAVTFSSLVLTIRSKIVRLQGGSFVFAIDGLQLIIATLLLVLGIMVVISCAVKIGEKDESPVVSKAEKGA
jgi:carbon starvation protein